MLHLSRHDSRTARQWQHARGGGEAAIEPLSREKRDGDQPAIAWFPWKPLVALLPRSVEFARYPLIIEHPTLLSRASLAMYPGAQAPANRLFGTE